MSHSLKLTALACLDSYKIGHPDQYPKGITRVSSNFTPRSEYHFGVPDEYKTGKIIWFGALQNFLHSMNEVWQETFFNKEWYEVANEAQDLYPAFCGPNGFNTGRLYDLWTLGYLPLEIKALQEGSHVNIGVPVLVITNTVDEFFWLPNSLETWLSTDLWKSSTSATTAYVYNKILNKYAEITGGSKDFIMWQAHDFSCRGMGGMYDSARSGAGHLTSSWGTDNVIAVKLIKDAYRGNECPLIGGSVPATEHAVMCAGGKESELETFKRLLNTYPSGIISIVSDTWDFWNVLTVLAPALKGQILARGEDAFGNGKTVFRPDSGDPVLIICGDPKAEPGSPAYKGAVECLAEVFGTTINAEGYKTLNKRVGLIYGDSITPQRAEEILDRLALAGYASDNIVFGVGSYTYQYVTRDTLGFAMKATYVEKNGVGEAIFKDPITDNGTKRSAKGLLRVDKVGQDFVLTDGVNNETADGGELKVVYLNGQVLLDDTFDMVRARVASGG